MPDGRVETRSKGVQSLVATEHGGRGRYKNGILGGRTDREGGEYILDED